MHVYNRYILLWDSFAFQVIEIIVTLTQDCCNNSTGKSHHMEKINLAFEREGGKKNLFSAFVECIADVVAVNVPVCKEQRGKKRDREKERKEERKKRERQENEGIVQTHNLSSYKQTVTKKLYNLRFHCKFSSSFLLEKKKKKTKFGDGLLIYKKISLCMGSMYFLLYCSYN